MRILKKLKFRPKAIICDMDGVIVDSMPYHFLAWYEALRPLGISVRCFDVYIREGERWQKSLEDFLKGSGISPTKETFKRVFMARKKLFRNRFKRFVFKGAKEFLICLKGKGYSLGMVTATTKDDIKEILPRTIEKLFDFIVTGDCVKKGKPYPEPYLKAAQGLKVMPSECVVIENAPYGVLSAKRAGMFCIALTSSLPSEYLKRADVIADNFEEISTMIDPSALRPFGRLKVVPSEAEGRQAQGRPKRSRRTACSGSILSKRYLDKLGIRPERSRRTKCAEGLTKHALCDRLRP